MVSFLSLEFLYLILSCGPIFEVIALSIWLICPKPDWVMAVVILLFLFFNAFSDKWYISFICEIYWFTFNEASFDREYESIWSGTAENAFFNGETFDKHRVLN